MKSFTESERGVGGEAGRGELAGLEAGPRGGGDHGGVVSGESKGGEGDEDVAAPASAVKRARSSRLAATPPVTRMRGTPRDSWAAKVFFSKSPTTEC